jgi:uncharacterized protein (TIGR02452 family)
MKPIPFTPHYKNKLALIAESTLSAIEAGFYKTGNTKHDIEINSSVLFTPEELDELRESKTSCGWPDEVIHTTETTLMAAQREAALSNQTLVLNFASANNPGGGFKRGAPAQEESLARSSALYPTIAKHLTYYDENRLVGAPIYTDHMILSENVLVFKDDAGNWLEQPYETSFLTVPAPNCMNGEQQNREVILALARRTQNICAVARKHNYSNLILGAFGCGVFHNDPAIVAAAFKYALTKWYFEKVTFAIPAGNETMADIFKKVVVQ